MKISLITVCYNSESTIQETLESVKEQNYPELEYIIIDGLSSDKTLSIINLYKDIVTKIISEKDKGIYDAINKGIKISTGSIVGILNSDDTFNDSTVLKNVGEKFENRNIGVLWGDVVFVNKSDKIVRYYSGENISPKSFDNGIMPPHPSVFIKKEIYLKLGDFNLKYQIASDYELLLRVLRIKKIDYDYIPKIIVRMKLGGVSNNNIYSIFKLNKEIYQIHSSHNLPISIYSLLKKIPYRLRELLRTKL